ncbi:hypothetical protein [Streptomyces agglomeratus]|uniref:hypothetical protein n=1 Tax=Streptomyces agglomeratus TaxID=285458 RepID=UPI001F0A3749|nr:hypothetical protein [Streptomyces agglomeratus]
MLEEESGPVGREITGWRIPGIGEMDIESEGFRLTVLSSGETVRAEIAFAGGYVESPSEPYRPLGPVTLVLADVFSLQLCTPRAPAGSLWKRVLRGEPYDEVLRMTWDQTQDVLHVRAGGSALVCRGGTWRWRTGG